MFKAPLIALLVSAGLAATAAPALAKASRSDEPSTRMTVKKQDGKTLYCVRQTPKTGTILTTDTCKSREEWAVAGLNIPAPARSADNEAAQPGG